MAMTKVFRRLFFACASLACSQTGCAPLSERTVRVDERLFADAPRRPGLETALVFVPLSATIQDTWKSLRNELEDRFDVVTRPLAIEGTEGRMAEEILAVRPTVIVLMGNLPLKVYLKYQRLHEGQRMRPAVAVMASFLEEQKAQFRNMTGIAYEVPGITSFVTLRKFVHRSVRRVGVIHRSAFRSYVQKQAELARLEKVEVVPLEVGDEPEPYDLRHGIDQLIACSRVDAIWVLNDNSLLTPELIAKGWLAKLHDRPIPVIVGVGSLVDTRLHFGAFAVLPDHSALGAQAANLIFRISENEWRADSEQVELPLSVQTVVDLTWTREHFGLREDALERIDRVVQ